MKEKRVEVLFLSSPSSSLLSWGGRQEKKSKGRLRRMGKSCQVRVHERVEV